MKLASLELQMYDIWNQTIKYNCTSYVLLMCLENAIAIQAFLTPPKVNGGIFS